MLWLELEGAVNIRDVGGIPTEDGGTTAPRRLLRADNLQNLSPADIAYLVDTVRLSTVVDLRTGVEVESEGPAPLTRIAHVEHVHHSLIPERAWGSDSPDSPDSPDPPDALLTRRERERTTEGSRDRMCAHYLSYVERRPEGIVGALRAITSSAGPALVHCAAGKDRTGVVVAFALSVAGAVREEIVRDYTATGERIVAIVERLSSSVTYAEDVQRVSIDRHTPKPESMIEFLDEINVRYGGVHSWLREHGFGDDEVRRLRDKLRDHN